MQALKLSTSQTSNKSAAFSAKDNAFKTSNPQIFPSLNPMGALYKQRKVSRPNPVVQEEEQCELAEPVKKLRCNTGSEKILPPTGYTKAEPSCREENVDKDGFRVPKLPRRLLNKNKAQSATTQETSKPLSEDAIRELKILQTATMIQMQYQNMQNKKHLEALDNGHNIEILDQGFDSSVLLNSLYDRLRLEYYAFQMRQLYQIYQNNDDQGLVWSLSDNQSEKMNREIHC